MSMGDGTGTTPVFRMERIHYFDHLRSLAMLLGIYVHACFPYGDGFKSSWFFQDRSTSVAITMGFLFLHLFRMPLFFFIAGFFANYMVHKRGVKGFVRNRLLRIGLPFIIFLPILLVGSVVTTITSAVVVPKENLNPSISKAVEEFGKNRTLNRSGEAKPATGSKEIAPAAVPKETDGAADPQSPPPTAIFNGTSASAESSNTQSGQEDPVITQHLWFLYYLLFFCLAAAVLQNLRHSFITKIFAMFFGSSLYIWLAPLLLVPALHTVGIPASTPGHIIPRLWPFGYYGVFFLLGWHFFYHQDYLDRIRRHLWPFVITGLFAAFLFLYLRPAAEPFRNSLPGWMSFDITSVPYLKEKTINVLLEAFSAVYLVMASLLLGKRFLDFNSRNIRFISDSSYWVYLMHYPLITFIQAFLVTLPVSIYIKFIASAAMVFGIGIVTYRYLVRYTFIGNMLNGKRVREQS
jgi:glucan biosynthesis protein C